jgi:peptidoglycan/LPS O-acetylase OafA/YrhL
MMMLAGVHPGVEEANPKLIHASDSAFSYWLDFFRWTAAFSVLLAHTQNRFLVQIADISPAHRGLDFYTFAFFAGFAHQAVMIFFVLSGYLVGGGLLREMQRKGAVDVPVYLVKRVTRLGIVLYPAFLVIAVLNLIGIFGLHGLATGVYPADTLGTMQPSTLLCNAAYLQNGFCHTYGEDGALWSLSNEFWYYVTWPLLLFGWCAAAKLNRVILTLLAISVLAVLTISFRGPSSMVGPYMLIWLLGIAVAGAKRPVIRSIPWSTALFLATVLMTRLFVRRTLETNHPIDQLGVDLLVACAFANLLTTMRFSKTLRPLKWGKLNYSLAAFSFSLYCVHIPILNLYGAAMTHYFGTGWKMIPDHLWNWSIVFGAMFVAIAGAFVFSRVTEVHTGYFRDLGIKSLEYLRRDKLDSVALGETKMR